MSTEDINEVTQEERNKALMIWAATDFVPFLPGKRYSEMKKNTKYIKISGV